MDRVDISSSKDIDILETITNKGITGEGRNIRSSNRIETDHRLQTKTTKYNKVWINLRNSKSLIFHKLKNKKMNSENGLSKEGKTFQPHKNFSKSLKMSNEGKT
jgi:hypothetical protein